jgi:hypothetical protein
MDKPAPEKDPETGRFLPGNNGGPGRPRGSRQKLSDQFFHELAKAFEQRGAVALSAMIDESPKDFIKTIATLQSKELTGEDGAALFAGLDVNIKR